MINFVPNLHSIITFDLKILSFHHTDLVLNLSLAVEVKRQSRNNTMTTTSKTIAIFYKMSDCTVSYTKTLFFHLLFLRVAVVAVSD